MTQQPIEFTIPGVPVPKARARVGRHGTYTPRATVRAENTVRSCARLMGCESMSGALRVELVFIMPIPKAWSKVKTQKAVAGEIQHVTRPDVDNLCKLLLDGLADTVFAKGSDAQVAVLIAGKCYGLDPQTRVRIVPL